MTSVLLICGVIYVVVTVMGLTAGLFELGEPDTVRRARGAHMILTCWAWPWHLLQWIPEAWHELRALDADHRRRG